MELMLVVFGLLIFIAVMAGGNPWDRGKQGRGESNGGFKSR
jgi:hypothetical protein